MNSILRVSITKHLAKLAFFPNDAYFSIKIFPKTFVISQLLAIFATHKHKSYHGTTICRILENQDG